MANKNIPDKSHLEKLLIYVPETGKLFWKKNSIKSKQWNTRFAGKEAFTSFHVAGYRHGSIDGINYLAHRIIYKLVYDMEPNEIDHIDRNRDNNHISNLRPSNKSKNQMNTKKRKNCSSAYKGVRFFKRDSNWAVTCNRKHIGYFETEIDAAIAYNNVALKEFGQYANLNVI